MKIKKHLGVWEVYKEGLKFHNHVIVQVTGGLAPKTDTAGRCAEKLNSWWNFNDLKDPNTFNEDLYIVEFKDNIFRMKIKFHSKTPQTQASTGSNH